MAKLTEHQLRLWKDMIQFIDGYSSGRIEFQQLVNSLQGALDAGGFKDQTLIKQWYSFWTPLEVYKAAKLDKEEPIIKQEVIKDVEAMRNFLLSNIK